MTEWKRAGGGELFRVEIEYNTHEAIREKEKPILRQDPEKARQRKTGTAYVALQRPDGVGVFEAAVQALIGKSEKAYPEYEPLLLSVEHLGFCHCFRED